MTDQPGSAHQLCNLYGQRMTIEQLFRDDKISRPTWTRELLARVMRRLTGVTVHPGTMSRTLQRIGARLGRPRPTVGCPWPKARKTRLLAEIAALEDGLSRTTLERQSLMNSHQQSWWISYD